MSDNQQFCLRWNNHQSTLVQVIDSLLSSGLLVDCTLAAEGQYLHAHKVILCACSPYLETLLSQHYEKHPIVILKDVKFQELKSMMDYMYKGEVNISQDQLGQFLKAAESLQIKGLTDGGGGENDSKDVGSTSHKRHDPPPIRKSVPPNQSRSSVVLPSHASGLTIEPSKRSLPSHLSESQPDSPIRSREGSSSPTPRKRRRPRRPSQGDDDGHQDNCDLPMQQQSILNTVPIIPQLPAGSSSTITKAPPPDEETDQPAESDVRLAESGLLKEKIEPQSELLIEPKTEYMEETNNDDSVEDLTLDDDDDYDNMDAAGPSHGGDNSNQSYGQWQMGERTHDEVFMAAQEAVGGGPRDSQDSGARIQISRKQSQKLQKLLLEKDGGNGKFTDEEIRRNASRLKIPAVKIRYWLKQRNAFDEGAPAKRPLNKTKMLLKKRRCKLFNDLSYEKKVKLLRKTNKVTKFTVSFNQQMADEFGVPADQLNNWLRYKIQRNANVKKTLTSGLVASLREKFEEYDYLDEDSAILLADEYNVTVALVKKAFAQRNTPTRSTKKAIAVTPPPPVDSSTAKKSKYKTVDQKNALFEAFRESPTMTKADTIAELCNSTGLRSKQISKWLNVMRSKWSQHNESSAKKLLTRGLKKTQLVELEKAYRRNRFLDDEQLDDLCKRIDKHKRAIQGWFSDRRIYEIRSNDKNIIDVEASSKKVPPAVEHVAESTPASELEDDDEFFNSLTEDQKAQLVEARTKFNVAYKRLSNQIGIPADKIENYIKSWRIRTNYITRVPNKRNLSDRVHKTLMSHFQQTDKISAKQAVILAKRLNIRPDQVKNWYHSRRRAVRSVGGVVSSANVPKSVPIKQNTPPAVRTKAALKCINKDKRNRIDVSHKQRLFEEYKKSPQISGSRAILVAAQCGMTPIQVRKWCYNFGKSISEQTLTKVISCLDKDNIGREARAKLEEQYRFRRYIEESEADAIAEEFNLTRTQVNNWFINARYYEILCGEYPGSQKTSESFYDSLDETVRARLKTELKSYPLDDETLDDLAEELDLPLDELKKWFECEACKIRRKSSAAPVQVSIKQKELLDSEFDIDPVVTDDRARTLSKRVHMTMDRIKLWFENRQEEKIKEKEADEAKLVKHKISPITIRMSKFPSLSSKLDQSPPSDSKPSCTIPAQQNKLFEEFKRSSVLNDQRLDKLSEQTGLSTKQIQAWFNWLRSKLSSLSKESLTDENRNRNLTSEQLQVLEKEYGESPYIDRTKRNLLSESIDLPKTTIKNWFANKRYHEILYNSSFTVDEAEKEFSEPSEEETENGTETVIDYDWEDESLVPKSTTDGEVSNDDEDEDDRRFDLDALFEPVENDDSDESELEHSPCDAFKEDFTSLPYQPKIRFAMPLGKDLEPSEDVEKLFWYVKKTPNKMGGNLDNEIDNEKKRVLESEFSKNPWPVMDRISLLSNKLQVSEPKIHWWFIKKRCFLTKTILNLPSPQPKPAPKNVLIDLTDDDPMTGDTAENDTLEESQIKLERFADDSVENGDSVEDTSLDEPPTERQEALQLSNAAQSANDNSTVVKKKKKKLPLTSHQHAILMREFKRKKFISTSRARMLAQDLGLSVTRVESLFEVWRRKIERKGNSAEKVSSMKTINFTIEAELEAEYLKSSDLNDSRVAAIASNLKILKKVVRKWFLERAKKT